MRTMQITVLDDIKADSELNELSLRDECSSRKFMVTSKGVIVIAYPPFAGFADINGSEKQIAIVQETPCA